MATLSNPTLWRTHPYSYDPLFWLMPRREVYTWRVNQASFTYPLAELTVDAGSGTLANVRPGMTVYIGSTPGASDLGWTYVRAAPTSTSLPVGLSSQGRRRGEVDPADNAYVTVLDLHEVWAKIPRITADGVQYRDETAYSRARSLRPIANGGIDRLAIANPDTLLGGFTFVTAASVSPAGLSMTFSWDFGDGNPGGSTDDEVGVDFPIGWRYVYLTATDTDGQSSTHAILVVVLDPDEPNALHVDNLRQRISTSPRGSTSGQTLEFRLLSTAPVSSYPRGGKVLYGEREYYGGTEAQFADVLKFTGWLDTSPATVRAMVQGVVKDTRVQALDAAGTLKRTRAFGMTARRKNSDDDEWNEIYHANWDRFYAHIVNWLSTASAVAPVANSGSGTANNFCTLNAGSGNLYDQLNNLALSIAYRFTCDMRGRLRVLKDPQRWDADSRTATETLTLEETDWTEFDVTDQPFPRVGRVRLSGPVVSTQDADDTAVVFDDAYSEAPGDAAGQGTAEETNSRMLNQSQSWQNAVAGHDYARANAPQSYLRFRLAKVGDGGIDPANMEWIRVNISAETAAQRGLDWTTTRALPIELTIEHAFTLQGNVKSVTLVCERETVGTPGIRRPPPQRPTQRPNRPPISNPRTGNPRILGAGLNTIGFIDSNGYFYWTTNFRIRAATGGPTWQRVNLGMAGITDDFIGDPFSARYLGTPNGAVDVWALTTERIYRITDIFSSSRAVTSQRTHDNPGGGTLGRIETERGQRNFVVATWVDPSTATYYNVTTDGTNWGSDTQVNADGSAYGPSALYVSGRVPDKFLISENKPGGATDGKVSLNAGASLSDSSSPNFDSESLAAALHLPFHDNADESRAYFGWYDPPTTRLYRADGAAQTDISPDDGGTYGPQFARALDTCAVDSSIAVLAGRRNGTLPDGSGDATAVWISRNARAAAVDWSLIPGTDGLAGGSYYTVARVAGDDGDVIYLAGTGGLIALSEDGGRTIDLKTGNLSSFTSPSVGRILNLIGG